MAYCRTVVAQWIGFLKEEESDSAKLETVLDRVSASQGSHVNITHHPFPRLRPPRHYLSSCTV